LDDIGQLIKSSDPATAGVQIESGGIEQHALTQSRVTSAHNADVREIAPVRRAEVP
jgi:hypothetical protein